MNLKGIKETCVYIKDLEQARKFYHEILGLKIISEVPEKHIFFKVGYSVLLCFNPEDSKTKKSPPPHYTFGPQHFAFEAPQNDYEDLKKGISKKGVQIIDEVTWPSGLQSFYFKDPFDNVLEIIPEGVWD